MLRRLPKAAGFLIVDGASHPTDRCELSPENSSAHSGTMKELSIVSDNLPADSATIAGNSRMNRLP